MVLTVSGISLFIDVRNVFVARYAGNWSGSRKYCAYGSEKYIDKRPVRLNHATAKFATYTHLYQVRLSIFTIDTSARGPSSKKAQNIGWSAYR